MNFKEAYKEIASGKRMAKTGLNVSTAEGSLAVKYLNSVSVVYMESGRTIKTDPSFIAAFDEKEGIHRLTDQNAVQMLLSDDDDWFEYVEPAPAPVVEDAVVEKVS